METGQEQVSVQRLIETGLTAKLLLVTTCLTDARRTGGGMTSVVMPLLGRLAGSGVQASLVCKFLPESSESAETKTYSVHTRFVAKSSPEGSELVHVHGLWTAFSWRACNHARRRGVPLVISPHGMLQPWARRHKAWKKQIAWAVYQKKLLQQADLLIVNSFDEKRTMRSLGLKGPIAVVENGVDTTGLDEADVSNERDKAILFLSRLSPVKGLPDLLKAWAQLPKGHGYELWVHGHADAGYESVIQNVIKNLNLDNSVKLLGPVFEREKWEVLSKASIFVLPSYSENFGIVVAEALLAGLPVITTRATPWGCLEQEGIGWIVDNDPEQLSRALWHAMQCGDKQLRQMGEKAAEFARTHFLWPQIVEKYIQTYAWVLGYERVRPEWVD